MQFVVAIQVEAYPDQEKYDYDKVVEEVREAIEEDFLIANGLYGGVEGGDYAVLDVQAFHVPGGMDEEGTDKPADKEAASCSTATTSAPSATSAHYLRSMKEVLGAFAPASD